MKISLSLDEVRDIVMAEIFRRAPSLGQPKTVAFIHKYDDGSGEHESRHQPPRSALEWWQEQAQAGRYHGVAVEADQIYPIDRVEVGFDEELATIVPPPPAYQPTAPTTEDDVPFR